MPGLPVFVSVDGAQRLRDLSKRLKDAGRGDLQKRLRTTIVDAAHPVEQDLRRAVMRVEVSSSKGGHAHPDRSTGLRARIAAAIRTRVTTRGVRIEVVGKKVDPKYGSALAKYTDATLGRYDRWRHPVFGNREVWREQHGQPWFGRTVLKHAPDFRRAIDAALEDVAEFIAKK